MVRDWNKGRWIFNDIHGYGYPYYHIHPYKQKFVKQMAEYLDPRVAFIVFGSSVGSWHNFWKDLDICLVHDENIRVDKDPLHEIFSNLDIITMTYTRLLEVSRDTKLSVYTDIYGEGVLVCEGLIC